MLLVGTLRWWALSDEISEPAISKIEGKVFTPDDARQLLSQEDSERQQQFNDGLVQLSRETGFQVAPCVIFPDNTIVSLASFLEGLSIKVRPHIQIVRGGS